MGCDTGWNLGYKLVSYPWTSVGIQLIVNILHGSKVRYPGFLVLTSQGTLVVPP